MSFFTTSTGENAASNATGEFNAGGGDFSPIPKDTRVLAMCDEAKISEYQEDRYINLKWTVAQPAEYKGRVVFQKIYALQELKQDVLLKKGQQLAEAYRDKALRMLAAIDANAGGKLAAANVEPTDLALQTSLTAKPMVLMLDVWDMNGQTGNWVREVSKHQPKQAASAPKPAPKPAEAPNTKFDDMDDDIAF